MRKMKEMKRLGIMIGLIFVVAILFAGGYFISEYPEKPTKVPLKTTDDLILATEFPESPKEVSIIAIEKPPILTEERAIEVASPFVDTLRKQKIESENDGAYWVKSDRAMVQAFPSGALIYSANLPDVREGEEITGSEACENARRFIEDHGSMPSDAYLAGTDVLTGINRATGDKKVKAYRFEFYHDFNGIPIRGNGGDSIKVRMNSYGEEGYYFNLWRKPTNIVESKPIISGEEAFEILQQRGRPIIKYPGDIYITKVQLVYYSAPFDKGMQEKLLPAWRFRVTGKAVSNDTEVEVNEAKDMFIYIDALTGEILLPGETNIQPAPIVDNDEERELEKIRR